MHATCACTMYVRICSAHCTHLHAFCNIGTTQCSVHRRSAHWLCTMQRTLNWSFSNSQETFNLDYQACISRYSRMSIHKRQYSPCACKSNTALSACTVAIQCTAMRSGYNTIMPRSLSPHIGAAQVLLLFNLVHLKPQTLISQPILSKNSKISKFIIVTQNTFHINLHPKRSFHHKN